MFSWTFRVLGTSIYALNNINRKKNGVSKLGFISYNHNRRNSLPAIKDGACIINIDEYDNIRTYWVSCYIKNYDSSYSGSFVVKYIPKEIKMLLLIKR